MRLATHAAFAGFFVLGVAAITEWKLTPLGLGLGVLASTLPEMDHEKSEIGSLFRPLSQRIANRWGHRTITHSFFGLGTFTLLISPLFIFRQEFFWAMVLGYLSHMLLDVFTPKGAYWFWPHIRPVGFGRARIKPGSAGESLMLLAFVGLAILLWPISERGAFGALREALGDIDTTYTQYRQWASTHEVFLEGKLQDNQTKQIFEGRWLIADLQGRGYLIRMGSSLRTVGKSPEYELYPLHVRVVAGGPSYEDPGRLVTLSFEVVSIKDLLVKEGQEIRVGEVLGYKAVDRGAGSVEELLKSRQVLSPISGIIRRLSYEAKGGYLEVTASVEVREISQQQNVAVSDQSAVSQDQAADGCPSIEVYFAPGNGPEDAIIRELKAAQSQVLIALYYLTDSEISWEIVHAFERGVLVQVLLDEEQREAKYAKGRFLAGKGIPVRYFEDPGIFHHKFAVIDKVVITGSYNWTASAQKENEENLLVIRDQGIARTYEEEWRRLWEQAKP